MQSLYRTTAVFLASFLIYFSASHAQAQEGYTVAIRAGIGGFSSLNLSNQAFFSAAEWYSGPWTAGIRAMVMGRDNSGISETPGNSARLSNNINEISAIAGYRYDARSVFAGIGLGPAFTFGKLVRSEQRLMLDTLSLTNDPYESVHLQALGLSIDSRLGAYLSHNTSLQVHGFFTRTSAISYLGYALEFGMQF